MTEEREKDSCRDNCTVPSLQEIQNFLLYFPAYKHVTSKGSSTKNLMFREPGGVFSEQHVIQLLKRQGDEWPVRWSDSSQI